MISRRSLPLLVKVASTRRDLQATVDQLHEVQGLPGLDALPAHSFHPRDNGPSSSIAMSAPLICEHGVVEPVAQRGLRAAFPGGCLFHGAITQFFQSVRRYDPARLHRPAFQALFSRARDFLRCITLAVKHVAIIDENGERLLRIVKS